MAKIRRNSKKFEEIRSNSENFEEIRRNSEKFEEIRKNSEKFEEIRRNSEKFACPNFSEFFANRSRSNMNWEAPHVLNVHAWFFHLLQKSCS